MSEFEPLTAEEVVTTDDLIEYIRLRFGVPVDRWERNRFLDLYGEFCHDNPHINIQVLVKAVDWAKDGRKKIRKLSGVFFAASDAFAAGALPELDPAFWMTQKVEDEISKALAVETDDRWRQKLMASSGDTRRRTINSWKRERGALYVGSG